VTKITPERYEVWNKFGGCSANVGRPAEALDAYYRALTLRPSFARALVNCGISFSMLHKYEEAVTYFLAAVKRSNDMHIWTLIPMFYHNLENFNPDDVQSHDLNTFRPRFKFDDFSLLYDTLFRHSKLYSQVCAVIEPLPLPIAEEILFNL
jgi:tetratricopeptide (TPR) repeat protein